MKNIIFPCLIHIIIVCLTKFRFDSRNSSVFKINVLQVIFDYIIIKLFCLYITKNKIKNTYQSCKQDLRDSKIKLIYKV